MGEIAHNRSWTGKKGKTGKFCSKNLGAVKH